MKIDFVTDYVCPYCIVAKEAIKQAAKMLDIDAEINTMPFELTQEPKPQVDTYHDEERKSHYTVLVNPAKELGIDIKLPPMVVPRPYTRLAFEGMLFARQQGKGEEWSDAMYHSYFVEEKDIGSIDVLVSAAEKLGLDGSKLKQALENGTYTAEEKEMVKHTREDMKIRHVPTIYIDGDEISLNDYSLEEMEKILRDKSAAPQSGSYCTEDGCVFTPGACGEDGCN